jgi:hypothetical protein
VITGARLYNAAAPGWLTEVTHLLGLNHNFIETPPQFFGHVASGHYGTGSNKSWFKQSFQNPAATYSLASFAANNGVQRPSGPTFQNTFTFTARYSSTVGYLRGTGAPTNFVTLVAQFTGYDELLVPQYEAITLYPDNPPGR